MCGMVKTTLYLPEELKAGLERIALREGRSEADLVREALADLVARRTPPKPRGAIFASGDPDWATNADHDLGDSASDHRHERCARLPRRERS